MNPVETKEKEKQGFFRAIKKKKKKSQPVSSVLRFESRRFARGPSAPSLSLVCASCRYLCGARRVRPLSHPPDPPVLPQGPCVRGNLAFRTAFSPPGTNWKRPD